MSNRTTVAHHRRGNVDHAMASTQPTFIDLFCGCGGFTLGMMKAGFRCLAAIDFNPEAIATLRENLPQVEHVLARDLTRFTPAALAELPGTRQVDVIIGGPPCQGFSKARQVDGANHGPRLTDDSRRYLYRDYLRFVDHFRPKVFVMENVPELRSAANGEFFRRIHDEAAILGHDRDLPGYRVTHQVESAWELGVPQRRHRLLIVGVREDQPELALPPLTAPTGVLPKPCLGLAIDDLPPLAAGEGSNECDYDPALREAYFQTYGPEGRKFLEGVLQVGLATRLRNHVARYHSPRDLGDFEKLLEGKNSATAMRVRKVEFDFPYDRSSFKDRYTRQSRSKPCSTIVAHLSKDGLMPKVRRRDDCACRRLWVSGGAGGLLTPRDRHSPPKEQAA